MERIILKRLVIQCRIKGSYKFTPTPKGAFYFNFSFHSIHKGLYDIESYTCSADMSLYTPWPIKFVKDMRYVNRVNSQSCIFNGNYQSTPLFEHRLLRASPSQRHSCLFVIAN